MGFIVSILRHLLLMILARVIFFIVLAFLFLWVTTRLFAQSPGDYLYVSDLELDNVGSGTSTRMMPVPVNALNYVNSGLISAVGDDRVFTDSNDVEVLGFTQNMTINAANWWVLATTVPTTVTTQKVFHGGADADRGFPLAQANLDNQFGNFTFGVNNATLRATPSATLQIDDLLDVRVDIHADAPCGWIVGKTGIVYQDPDGWGMFAIGTKELAPANNGAGGANNAGAVFFEVTPLNFDAWICTFGPTTRLAAASRANADHNVRFIDVDTGATICNESFVDIIYDAVGGEGPANSITLLPQPCLVKQNQHARIIYEAPFSAIFEYDTTGACNLNSTNFKFEINCGCTPGACNIGTAEAIFRNATNRLQITYVPANSSATSTGAVAAFINDTFVFSGATKWNGERATLQLTYNDPVIQVLKDSIVIASGAHAGGIATTTSDFDLRIGRGFNEGAIHNFEIDAGVVTVLDVDFEGDDISQTQIGDVSNFYHWLGDIDDESGQNNDLQYVLVANMTNINTAVSGFRDNPTPTPIPGISGTSTALTGSPSLNPFFTPVPTPTGGLIMGPIKDAASASTLPAETWYMILGTLVLAVSLGFFHKFFPNRPIFAALSVVGMAIISLTVGDDFRMWIVAIYAMWAFGSTSLLILWAR